MMNSGFLFKGCLPAQVLVLLVLTWLPVSIQAAVTSNGPVGASLFQAEGSVTFLDPTGQPLASVSVEIADDQQAIRKGLMYRRSLPPQAGMLFVYEDERPRSFWMKNTTISLDMIFAAQSGEIVTIVEKTEPMSLRSCRSVSPARFVVEVNAGFCEKYGIKAGDIMKIASF